MVFDVSIARQIASYLLNNQAVILSPNDPFTWSSGWKAPIYCDNRILLAYPEARSFIKRQFLFYLQKESQKVNAIAGVATAGIPHATMVADELGLPMVYVRSSKKEHGTENKVEGKLEKGQNVFVIEDLISTGGSSLKAIDTIREANCQVGRLLAVFTYGFDIAEKTFEEKDVPVTTLCNYSTLLDVALEQNYVSSNEVELLENWRKKPDIWG